MEIVVYMLTCPVTGKSYVGQTQNLNRRLNGHRTNMYAKKRWPHGFCSRVLATCPTRAAAADVELAFIDHYNTIVPNGWNDRRSGHAPHIFSDATRRKMSLAKIGRWPKGEHPLVGRKKTAAHVEKMAARMQGKPAHNKGTKQTDEQRKRNSESHKGQKAHNKGKPWSDEVKRKISEAKKAAFAARKAAMPIIPPPTQEEIATKKALERRRRQEAAKARWAKARLNGTANSIIAKGHATRKAKAAAEAAALLLAREHTVPPQP